MLRNWIRDLLGLGSGALTLLFESFAYKDGIPLDADLVLDARMLPNPHYDPKLRPLTGRDAPVIEFLARATRGRRAGSRTCARFSRAGCPSSCATTAAYVTVAIGCTGGRHRSVYLAEQLAERFRARLAGAGAPPRPRRRNRHERDDLPLFPLNTVLFPGGRLPLRIFEQRYMDMAKACLRDGAPFGVCLIREGAEVGAPAMPSDGRHASRASPTGTCRSSACCRSSRAASSASASSSAACSPTASRAAAVELLAETADARGPRRTARAASSCWSG